MLPEVIHPLNTFNINNETISTNLYIKNYTGLQITQNPFSNAILINNKLVVKGDYRDITYNIVIEASNSYGKTQISVTIKEGATQPIILKYLENIPIITNNTIKIDLSKYFKYYKMFYLVFNPQSSAHIVENYLHIVGNHRNASYIIIVGASNSLGTVTSNILITEDNKYPIIKKQFSELLTETKEYVYDIGLYVDFADSYEIIQNPFDNVRIVDDKLFIVASSRNTEYNVIIHAINKNHLNDIHTTPWILTISENIDEPIQTAPFEYIVLSNEKYILNLDNYFSGTGITYSAKSNFQNVQVENNFLEISPSFRNLQYEITIVAKNINFMRQENTVKAYIIVSEGLEAPKLKVNDDRIGPIYLTDDDYSFNLLTFFSGESLQFEYECDVSDSIFINNNILVVQPKYRNRLYEVHVYAYNVDHNGLKSVMNPKIILEISEDIFPCSLKNVFSDKWIILNDNEFVLDLSNYIQGDNISYTANSVYNNVSFDGTLMIIKNGYKNISYSIQLEAFNENYLNKKYEISKTLTIFENIRFPNVNNDGGFEAYDIIYLNDTKRINLLEVFTGDSLTFKCSAPGIIDNDNILVINPNYRNKEYKIEVVASNVDYFEKKHSIASVLTVSESIIPPVLKSNDLSDIGILRLTDANKYINLSDYFENVKTYKYMISEKSGSADPNISLKYDVLTFKPNYNNIKYKIDIIGTSTDYRGVLYSISSSFYVIEDIISPSIHSRIGQILLYEEYEIDLLDIFSGPELSFEIDSNYEYVLQENILILRGDYRDLTYNVGVRCFNTNVLSEIHEVYYNINVKEPLRLPFIHTNLDMIMYYKNNLLTNYGFGGSDLDLSQGVDYNDVNCNIDVTNSKYFTIVTSGIPNGDLFVNINNNDIIITSDSLIFFGLEVSLINDDINIYIFDFQEERFIHNGKEYDIYHPGVFLEIINAISFNQTYSKIMFYDRYLTSNDIQIIKDFINGNIYNVKSLILNYSIDIGFNNVVTIDLNDYFLETYDYIKLGNEKTPVNVSIESNILTILGVNYDYDLYILSGNAFGETILCFNVSLPRVDVIKPIADLVTYNEEVEIDLNSYFKYANYYEILVSDVDSNVKLYDNLLIISSDYRNKKYEIFVTGRNSKYYTNIKFYVSESIRPPIILNGGFEEADTFNNFYDFMEIQLSKYFKYASEYQVIGQNGAIINGYIKVTNERDSQFKTLTVRGITYDFSGASFMCESVLSYYDFATVSHVNIYDRILYSNLNRILNSNYDGIICEFTVIEKEFIYDDIDGPYYNLLDTRTNLFLSIDSNLKRLYLDEYKEYDVVNVFVLKYDTSSNGFYLFNPYYGYLNTNFNFDFETRAELVYFDVIRPPILNVPLRSVFNTCELNLNMLFKYASSFECILGVSEKNTIFLDTSQTNRIPLTARNASGYVNHILHVADESTNVCLFELGEDMKFDNVVKNSNIKFTQELPLSNTYDSVALNNNTFYQTNEFTVNYGNGWTLFVVCQLNDNNHVLNLDTPVCKVDIIGYTIKVSINDILYCEKPLNSSANIVRIAIDSSGNLKVNDNLILSNIVFPVIGEITDSINLAGNKSSIIHLQLFSIVLEPNYFDIPNISYSFSYSSFDQTRQVFYASETSKYDSIDSSYLGDAYTVISNSNSYYGEWIQVEFQSYVLLQKLYVITGIQSQKYILVGSFDSYTWHDIIPSTQYKYYRIIFRESTGKDYIEIQDIRFFVSHTFLPKIKEVILDRNENELIYDLDLYFEYANHYTFILLDYTNAYINSNIFHLQKEYNDNTYDVNIYGFNSLGGVENKLVVYETILPVEKKKDFDYTDIFLCEGYQKAFDLDEYFANAYLYDFITSINHPGVSLDFDTNTLTILNNYSNQEFRITVIAKTIDHRNVIHSVESIITVSESVRPPNLIKEFVFIDMKTYVQNFVKFNLDTYFEYASSYERNVSIDHPEILIDNIQRTLTINNVYANQQYTITVIGVSVDHNGIRFTKETNIVVSESVRKPIFKENMNLPEIIRYDAINEYDLNEYFENVSSYSFTVNSVNHGIEIDENGIFRVNFNYRNKLYTVTLKAINTDYMGVKYELPSTIDIVETVRSPSIKKEFDMIYLTKDEVLNLNDFFNDSHSYDVVPYDVDVADVVFENLYLYNAFRNKEYTLTIKGIARDFENTEYLIESDLVISENIISPSLKNASIQSINIDIIYTHIEQVFSLSQYIRNASIYVIEIIDIYGNKIEPSNKYYTIENALHRLTLRPNYRDIAYEVFIYPQNINYLDEIVPSDKSVYFVIQNIIEGPPLPTFMEPNIKFISYLTSSVIYESVYDYVIGVAEVEDDKNNIMFVNEYSNSVKMHAFSVYNISGSSIGNFFFNLKEGPMIPSLTVFVNEDYVFMNGNNKVLQLNDYFDGDKTFYKCDLVINCKYDVLLIDSTKESKKYTLTINAGNESGLSDPLILHIRDSYDTTNGFLVCEYNGYFENNIDSIINYVDVMPEFINYSWNFKSLSTISNKRISDYLVKQDYTLEIQGYFKPYVSGNYTFYIKSDDASLFWIDNLNTVSVENIGLHDSIEKTVTKTLQKDVYYPIKLLYGNNENVGVCNLSFTGPNTTISRSFKDYIYWIKSKQFSIMYDGMYLCYDGVIKVGTTGVCIFMPIMQEDSNKFLLFEVNSMMYLRSRGNNIELQVYDDNEVVFYEWNMILNIIHSTYVFKNRGMYLDFDFILQELFEQAFYFSLELVNICIQNGGLESISPLLLKEDAFEIDLRNFIIDAKTYNITNISNVYLDQHVLKVTKDSKTDPYEVVVQGINGGKVVETKLIVHHIFVPMIIKEFPVFDIANNETIQVNINEYVSNVSSMTCTFDYFNNVVVNDVLNSLFIEGNNRNQTYYININVKNTNDYSENYCIAIKEYIIPIYPPTLKGIGLPVEDTVILTNDTRTFTLSNYFDIVSGRFDFTVFPVGVYSIDISNGVLSVTGSYKGKSYDITVRAYNDAGEITSVLSVEELILPPSLKGNGLAIEGLVSLTDNTRLFPLSNYYNGSNLTYTFTVDPVGSYSISINTNKELVVTGSLRGVKYDITVIATNSNNMSVSSVLRVSESMPATTLSTPTAIGHTGPTLVSLKTLYSNYVWVSDSTKFKLYNNKNGYQQIYLGAGTYSFEAYGAAGGRSQRNFVGGNGGKVKANFVFNEPTNIIVIIGQRGTQPTTGGHSGGGGGGTFIVKLENSGNTIPLLCAGGGGGGGGGGTGGTQGIPNNINKHGGYILHKSINPSVCGNSTYKPGYDPAKSLYNGAGFNEDTGIVSVWYVSQGFVSGFNGASSTSTPVPGGFGGGGLGMTGSAGAGGGGGGWCGGANGQKFSDGNGGTSYYADNSPNYVTGSVVNFVRKDTANNVVGGNLEDTAGYVLITAA